MMAIAERRSWRSQAFCIGVWPDGAQVRRRTGWSIKPLSSKKTRGVSDSRAPFLSAANRAFANVPVRRRPTLAPVVLASGLSSQGREESSRHDRDGSEPGTAWLRLPPLANKSKDRCGSRPFAVLLRESSATSVSERRSSGAWDRDAAWLSTPPCRLSSGLASSGLPKTRKHPRFPLHRRLSCHPAGVVQQADGESPTRLRFLAFS
jgi:hypothetical protein